MRVEFYTDDIETAKSFDELDMWRESYRENIACSRDIDKTLSDDGYNHKPNEAMKPLIDEYGLTRIIAVLSNTINQNMRDDRYSNVVKEWAKANKIYHDKEYTTNIVCNTHPVFLNGFAHEVIKAEKARGLYTKANCIDDDINLEGNVIVVSTKTFKEDCKTPENQLWLATGGFGCAPNSRGRAVFATSLFDNEKARLNREQVIGIMKQSDIPQWALDKLSSIQDEKLVNENESSDEMEI